MQSTSSKEQLTRQGVRNLDFGKPKLGKKKIELPPQNFFCNHPVSFQKDTHFGTKCTKCDSLISFEES